MRNAPVMCRFGKTTVLASVMQPPYRIVVEAVCPLCPAAVQGNGVSPQPLIKRTATDMQPEWCVPANSRTPANLVCPHGPWRRGTGVDAAPQRRMPPVGGPCESPRHAERIGQLSFRKNNNSRIRNATAISDLGRSGVSPLPRRRPRKWCVPANTVCPHRHTANESSDGHGVSPGPSASSERRGCSTSKANAASGWPLRTGSVG